MLEKRFAEAQERIKELEFCLKAESTACKDCHAADVARAKRAEVERDEWRRKFDEAMIELGKRQEQEARAIRDMGAALVAKDSADKMRGHALVELGVSENERHDLMNRIDALEAERDAWEAKANEMTQMWHDAIALGQEVTNERDAALAREAALVADNAALVTAISRVAGAMDGWMDTIRLSGNPGDTMAFISERLPIEFGLLEKACDAQPHPGAALLAEVEALRAVAHKGRVMCLAASTYLTKCSPYLVARPERVDLEASTQEMREALGALRGKGE